MSGGMDDGDDGSTRVFQSFASYELLIFGEFAPYDRYAVDKPEIFIGRDPKKCQIVLNDSEVSSVHAVLRKNFVNMTLEDLNSSNGTLLNGQRINKTELDNNDEFIIGSTTFTVQVVSDLLESEGDRLMPVEEGQIIERIEEIEEEIPLDGLDGAEGIDFNTSDEVQEKSALKRIWKDPKKRKKLIFGVVGLLLVMALLDDEPAKVEKTSESDNKEAQVAPEENPEQKVDPNKRQLSPDEIRALEAKYKIAESYVNDKKLDEALAELEQILSVDPDYANAKILYSYFEKQNRQLQPAFDRQPSPGSWRVKHRGRKSFLH
jgi:pSer/pThr/pTyr-binding forkhead associated (FHA) protein